MPIPKNYRKEWVVIAQHHGHNVWTTEATFHVIHGTIVGVDFHDCTGCMKCTSVCPVSVFSSELFEGRYVADPTNEQECILCLACEIVCRPQAIHVIRSGGSDDTLDALLHAHG